METKRLIDANALYIQLGKLAREPDYQHEGEDWGDGVAMAMGEVWSAPTVDAVEVVHGRWEEVTDQDEIVGEMDFYKCSVCGKLRWFATNYCPNCGAKMDGDGNG